MVAAATAPPRSASRRSAAARPASSCAPRTRRRTRTSPSRSCSRPASTASRTASRRRRRSTRTSTTSPDEEQQELGIDSLPHNLEDALDALEADEVIRDALGEHIFEAFLAEKRAEWNDYRSDRAPVGARPLHGVVLASPSTGSGREGAIGLAGGGRPAAPRRLPARARRYGGAPCAR
ncbi:MAG: hypothetical protein V9F04_14900 [Dermatophilaceae bacterium]